MDRRQKFIFPVEVKYQSSLSDWDFQVMEKAFGKGWIVTPSIDRERIKTKAVSLQHFFEQVGSIKQPYTYKTPVQTTV